MDNLLKRLLTRKGRIYLYSTGIAVIALLSSYGLVSGDAAAAWSALLAPLFGLAIVNVPDKEEE